MARKTFKSEEQFRLTQRINELAKAIRYWPNSILMGQRIEEMEELENKLSKLEDKDDQE